MAAIYDKLELHDYDNLSNSSVRIDLIKFETFYINMQVNITVVSNNMLT